MLRKILLFITGMLLVLVTGVFWGTWFSLSRTMYTLPEETFVVIGKQIMQNVALGMSIMMPLGIAGIIILLFLAGRRKKAHCYWLLSSLILFTVALVITLFIEVPIDNQIKTWSAENPPQGWEAIRDRWQFYHTDRTFCSLAGMASFLMAVIKRYS
ncbi:hypothetical protein A4D02_35685 [Niastella koreensis]|uniref:DUF1772 domain-containing protein n=2 Tax=Niastella koreensis TaxID=354356 RepID=G8T8R9_NIAKG|nr:DUF1772 domain-containing protein [Niastella koreensis]AEW01249.1 Protein of unknown function DUF2266, transmembrane [Niastella koreensis GR20-10]OQP44191.1 hypothetical protein A4D02_35685 [Niastella koreensis]